MGQIFMEGFLLQASLIFALGAQNLYVLESGLRKNHYFAVSFVCFVCDLTIIMMGVIGMAALLNEYPEIKVVFGVLGVGFLSYYGIAKIMAKGEQILLHETLDRSKTLKKSILSAVAFSVINPHAYLDGIVLIGGYSTKFHDIEQRLLIGLGASIYSLVWFLLLSSASSKFLPLFTNPQRMRLVTRGAGVLLVYLSLKLSVDVYGWIIDSGESGFSVVLQAGN